MTILDQEFTKSWFRSSLMCLGIFVVLFLIGDLFGLTEDFFETQPGIPLILEYFALRAVFSIFFLSPLVVLLGGYWSIVNWKRHNEWIASLSSGSSPFHLLRGPMVVLLILFLGLAGFNFWFFPQTAERMHFIRDHHFKERSNTTPLYENLHLFLGPNRTLRIGKFKPGSKTLRDITVTEKSGQQIKKRIRAAEAHHQSENRWKLVDVNAQIFEPDGSVRFDTSTNRVIELENPNTLRVVFQNNPRMGSISPEQLSVSDLTTMIQFRNDHGLNHSVEAVYYHWKFAYPLSTVILGLAGLILGIRLHVKRTTGIALCILFGFLYWIGFNLLLALGQSSTYLGGYLNFSFILLSAYGAPLLTIILLWIFWKFHWFERIF